MYSAPYKKSIYRYDPYWWVISPYWLRSCGGSEFIGNINRYTGVSSGAIGGDWYLGIVASFEI